MRISLAAVHYQHFIILILANCRFWHRTESTDWFIDCYLWQFAAVYGWSHDRHFRPFSTFHAVNKKELILRVIEVLNVSK